MTFQKVIRKLRRYLGNPNLNWTKFPLVIQIDTNNHCGQKYCGLFCTYCKPQDDVARKLRRYMEMPFEWIEWILLQIAHDGRTMSFLDHFLNGDALAEPRLHKILAASKRICPWLPTQTFTCGTLTENMELILDRNLDSICFTISAHTDALYRKVHRSEKFGSAITTLKKVLEKRHSRQNVEVHCVITKDNFPYLEDWWNFFGREEFGCVKRVLSPLVASYDNEPSRRALGDLTLDVQEKAVIEIAGEKGRMWTRDLIPDLKPCVLWDNMSIDAEGFILQCCNWSSPYEWNYGTVAELIREGRSLREVWIERLANRMRNKLCRSCNMKHPEWEKRLTAMKTHATVNTSLWKPPS